MALKDRIRKAVFSSTSSSSRKESSSAPSSPEGSSPSSSGLTTPALSREASNAGTLPVLVHSATLNLTKTTTTSSKLSLSRFRSNTSAGSKKQKQNWAKYAPKNYKFRVANPEHVATLNAWEWSYGSNARASVSSAFSGISPSRNPSMDIPRARHVEDVAEGR